VARATAGNPGCSRCGGSGVQSFIPKRGPLAGTVQMGGCLACFPSLRALRVSIGSEPPSIGKASQKWAERHAADLRPTLDEVRAARRAGEA
jgi:hypothetical protein